MNLPGAVRVRRFEIGHLKFKQTRRTTTNTKHFAHSHIHNRSCVMDSFIDSPSPRDFTPRAFNIPKPITTNASSSVPSSTSSSPTNVSHVNVYCRVRPPLEREEATPEVIEILNDQHLLVTNGNERGQNYQLDKIFGPNASQEDVYNQLQPSINECFDGYNTTIFAYGQTGTGKTHTILGVNLWEMATKEVNLRQN